MVGPDPLRHTPSTEGWSRASASAQSWDERLPGRLVPPIPEGLAKVAELAAFQGPDEQECPLKVEHRVAEGHGLGQDFARRGGLELSFRRAHDQLEGVGPVPGAGLNAAFIELTAQGQTTKQGRRRIVGMTFDLGREREQLRRLTRGGERLVESQAGDRGRRAAAEPRPHRDVAAYFDDQARRRAAETLPSEAECALDPVFADERRSAHERALKLPGRAGPYVDDVQREVQLDRHRKGVEAGSEVGNRPRHGNLPRSGVAQWRGASHGETSVYVQGLGLEA